MMINETEDFRKKIDKRRFKGDTGYANSNRRRAIQLVSGTAVAAIASIHHSCLLINFLVLGLALSGMGISSPFLC